MKSIIEMLQDKIVELIQKIELSNKLLLQSNQKIEKAESKVIQANQIILESNAVVAQEKQAIELVNSHIESCTKEMNASQAALESLEEIGQPIVVAHKTGYVKHKKNAGFRKPIIEFIKRSGKECSFEDIKAFLLTEFSAYSVKKNEQTIKNNLYDSVHRNILIPVKSKSNNNRTDGYVINPVYAKSLPVQSNISMTPVSKKHRKAYDMTKRSVSANK